MKKRTLWITQTAVFLALLIVIQAVTASFGSTLITGSMVNLILIVSLIIGGLSCGLTVALLSPIMAFILSIGPPFWQIILFIALGNSILVATWYLIAGKQAEINVFASLFAAIMAALLKFGFLYVSVVKFVIPILLQLPATKATVVGAAFAYPQLLTALIGGLLATLLLPTLKQVKNKH